MATKARVRIVVEIELVQPWSDDARLMDVFERAKRDALEEVATAMTTLRERWRIVGCPVVEAVIKRGEGDSEGGL